MSRLMQSKLAQLMLLAALATAAIAMALLGTARAATPISGGLTYEANATVTAGRVVQLVDTDEIEHATSAADAAIGIAESPASASAGQFVRVAPPFTRTTVTSGEAFSRGDLLCAGAAGKAFALDANSTTQQRIVAMALEAATAADETVDVLTLAGHQDVIHNGDIATAAAIARSKLDQDDNQVVGIPLVNVRQVDGDTIGADWSADTSLGINAGGWGSGTVTLDANAASGASVTATVMFTTVLPAEYVAGETVQLVVSARESVDAATVATTISAEVYESDGDGTVSADLAGSWDDDDVTTSWADHTLTITPTNLAAGDELVVMLRLVCNDTGGSVGTIAQVGRIKLTADIKG